MYSNGIPVFQSPYDIVEIQEVDKQIIVSTALNSIHNVFLQDNKMTCKLKLSFESAKISKIESLDCENADWGMLQ